MIDRERNQTAARPLRIAFIGLRGVPAQYSGVERAVEEIGARLVERGHDVTVYCMAGHYPSRLEHYRGMRLEYIPTVSRKNMEMICYSLLSTLKSMRQRFDVTHFHALGPSTMSFLPRLLGRKTVVTVQGLDWQRQKWGRAARAYLKWGEWTSHHVPNRTIVVSRQLKQYYDLRSRGPIHYIPNGAPAVMHAPLREAAEKFGVEPRKYLLYVGRLTREKNVDVLIRAFRRVATDKKLVIVGGSSHTDDYVAELGDLAAADPRIVLTGPIYDHLLPQLYSNAYLFVLPSALEGLPVVLMEALAYGNVVLVSDIPENLEVITDGEIQRGFIFPTGDVTGLGAALRDLNEQPQKVDEMRDFGRRLVTRKYDWDRITDETLDVYLGLAGQ